MKLATSHQCHLSLALLRIVYMWITASPKRAASLGHGTIDRGCMLRHCVLALKTFSCLILGKVPEVEVRLAERLLL